MKIYPSALEQQLLKPLPPVFMVVGEEPLQQAEAMAAIRYAAKRQGFAERICLSVDSQFNPRELVDQFHAMSLFAEQKIVELDFADSKPNSSLTETLNGLAEHFNPDTLLLVRAERSPSEFAKANWFKQFEQLGVLVSCYSLEGNMLRNWLLQRAKKLKLNLSQDGIALLADYYSGNLLAASQELEKLSLLYGQVGITLEQLQHTLVNQSHFDAFDLTAAVIDGNSKRVAKIMARLALEGVEPTLILWALVREIEQLSNMQAALNQHTFAAVCKQFRIFKNRENAMQAALHRLSPRQLQQLICQASELDIALKSGQSAAPYQALLHLALSYCVFLPFAAPVHQELS